MGSDLVCVCVHTHIQVTELRVAALGGWIEGYGAQQYLAFHHGEGEST